MFVGTSSSQFSLSGDVVECRKEGRRFMIMVFPTNNLDLEQGAYLPYRPSYTLNFEN